MNMMNYLKADGYLDKYGYVEICEGTLNSRDILDELVFFLRDVYDDPVTPPIWNHPLTKKDKEIRKRLRTILLTYYSYITELELISEEEEEELPVILEKINSFLTWDVCNFLEEIAPKGYYFGSNPGNTSSMGYWPIKEDCKDELVT